MAPTDLGDTRPTTRTLYDPAFEHDACGVGLVADLKGRPSHALVRQGLAVLERLAHRGASGAEVDDRGRGRHPDPAAPPLPRRGGRETSGSPCLPRAGTRPGAVFLPTDPDDAAKARAEFEGPAPRRVAARPRVARGADLGCDPR